MKHYIYILHSLSIDKYYIGYSTNVENRLEQHNNSPFLSFTSKGRPWVLKAQFEVVDKKTSLEMEKWIKNQKSRKFIEKLIDENFELIDKLALLVRVPKNRD